ncbi:MAG: SIR2 family protein [Candidatus Limnocylindrales bacterium]
MTFNYDRVLETALDRSGPPYRRFPERLLEISGGTARIDVRTESQEVLLVKVHGSIDWISWEQFQDDGVLSWAGDTAGQSSELELADTLYRERPPRRVRPLIEGPVAPTDPLRWVLVVQDIDGYYRQPDSLYSYPPLILAPSTAKQLYSRPFEGMWRGIDGVPSYWAGVSLIGYSLPSADPYALQALYGLTSGYGRALDRSDPEEGPKRRIEVVNLATSPQDQAALLRRYRFIPRRHATFMTSGFSEASVDALFQ